ncbi:MAG: hypothetical protein JO296_05665 [Pseudonocardiales bacterium]|nr:hypothetical protein [Pseudonocardiales bacterium]MBV9649613.1 hypothetical protein [Pseudonocardiales bacterium]
MKGQHVNSRKLAGASAASVGAATAVAALLLGTLSGSAGEEPTASAFGLAAEGLLPIAPTPKVEAPPDERKALLEVPGPDSHGIYVGVLKVEAEKFRSKATAVKVDILGIKLKVLEATCEDGHGDSSIIKTDDGGKSSSPVGQELNLSPILKVEFNRQHHDHDKLTVDAAVISLLPADKRNAVLSAKDLNLFQSVASNKYKVPTMAQVQDAHTKSGAPAGTPATVTDLLSSLKVLNPSLVSPTAGHGALEEIVISSASCREHHENRPPHQEAPPPKPVEAHLPVTH